MCDSTAFAQTFLTIFYCVLRHVTVECQIGNDLFYAYVFSAKSKGLADFGRSESAEPHLSVVECRFGDAELTDNFGD